jgi:hypothetical protein
MSAGHRDRRPELSEALRRIDEQPWFTWPNPALRLRLAPDLTGDYSSQPRAIIAKRGRFGLATVIEKDPGPRCPGACGRGA